MNTQYGRPETMTEQGVFDKIASHLMKQGTKCIDRDGACNYRNGFGQACAAGCLLTDEEATNSNAAWRQQCPEDLVFCVSMVIETQNMHDCEAEWDWPRRLVNIAKNYDLDPSIIFQCERGGAFRDFEFDEELV